MKNMLMRNSSLVHVISIYNIFFKSFLHKNIKDYIFSDFWEKPTTYLVINLCFILLFKKNMLTIL